MPGSLSNSTFRGASNELRVGTGEDVTDESVGVAAVAAQPANRNNPIHNPKMFFIRQVLWWLNWERVADTVCKTKKSIASPFPLTSSLMAV